MEKTSHLPELTPKAVNEVLDQAFEPSDRDIFYRNKNNLLPLSTGNDRLAAWYHLDDDAYMCYFDNNRFYVAHHDLFSDTVTIEIHYTRRQKPRLRRFVAQPPHNLIESQAVQSGEAEMDEIDDESRLHYQWTLYDLTPDSWRILPELTEKDRELISSMSKSEKIRRHITGITLHEDIENGEVSREFIQWLDAIKAAQIESKNRSKIYRLLIEHQEKIKLAPGSQHNHQAWPGGYMEHTRQVNTYAIQLFDAMVENGTIARLPEGERFDVGELLTVTTLHDIEKPFRYELDKDGQLRINENLRTKDDREAFKKTLLNQYGIELSPLQQEALAHAEGIRDHEYRSDLRVMSPMATIVHTADLLSARVSYSTVIESKSTH